MIKLWLRQQEMQGLFEEGCNIDLNFYGNNILMGTLDNSGLLSKLKKRFVLGKEGVWIPEGTDRKISFVRIDNSSAYLNGLILAPYSADVDYHSNTNSIGKTTNFEQVYLEEGDSFVEQVLATYYNFDSLVKKFRDKDKRFILYSTIDRKE